MSTIDRIDGYAEELTAIRRDLHAHPEIGFEEVRTSGIVAEKLKGWGIEVHRGLGGTGVIGVLKGKGNGGKRIGLRADMDALPMEENTNLKWRSTISGRFHGCGHDGHTTMLLSTARILRPEFRRHRAFHLPARRGGLGARASCQGRPVREFPCDEVTACIMRPTRPRRSRSCPDRRCRRRFLRHQHPGLWRTRRNAGTFQGRGGDRDDAGAGLADHRQPQRRSLEGGGAVGHPDSRGLRL
jgi:metal-dependent amidase/aminoacylase/carboxypeptidase family protein